jgi:hypothetical protein
VLFVRREEKSGLTVQVVGKDQLDRVHIRQHFPVVRTGEDLMARNERQRPGAFFEMRRVDIAAGGDVRQIQNVR